MSRARQLADSADLSFDDGTLVIDSGNNRVGIGTTSPSYPLEVAGDITINNGLADGGNLRFQSSGNTEYAIDNFSGNLRILQTGVGEVARFDSSGNLLVGKTSTTLGAEGSELRPDGQVRGIRDGGTVLLLNRLTDDGTIAAFYQNSSPAGEIGNSGANLYIQGRSGKSGLEFSGTSINPRDDLALSDGVNDLGSSAYRFKDLYLSGGVYLGGTGAANKLEDYEEGTFTPVYQSRESNPITVTYNRQEGRYIKIGNMVKVSLRLRTSSVSGGSSDSLEVGGLPFNAFNFVQANYPGAIGRKIGWGTTPQSAYVPANENNIIFIENETTGDLTKTNDLDTGASDNDLSITIVYRAA